MPSSQLIIFGASGDLTRRKLIPALVRLEKQGLLGSSLQIIGVARSEKSDQGFRQELAESLPDSLAEAFESFRTRLFYRRADVTDSGSVEALKGELNELAGGAPEGRLYYLSLKPALFARSLSSLATAHMLAQDENSWRRVIVEKPFGHDRQSAHTLNESMHEYLQENQIYRIDHYLGKETVQNILGFRFHNTIFEPLWNRHHIELVQITVAESIGVEKGRAAFYDSSGAMRDVVQNHMLQLLALVAMEAPNSLDGNDIRNQKVEVLKALHCPDQEDVSRYSVRARYAASEVEGQRLAGYLQEEGVPTDSNTETFAAMRAEVDSWRWSGVPFLLRHGKRMKKRFTEIQVQFRNPPIQLFNRPEGVSDAEYKRMLKDGSVCHIRPNILTISIQPKEELSLSFGVKRPGASMVMTPAKLNFNYEDVFHVESPPAYQRLLLDALSGDPTLFLRADEIDASWRYADEVIKGWKSESAPPLLEYPAGSWGPEEADELFQGCEGGWSRGH